jgi:hypothetical protein
MRNATGSSARYLLALRRSWMWEALCRDGNSYSRTIPPESNAGIELVSCRELLATSKMLLERAGSKSKPTGCRINE